MLTSTKDYFKYDLNAKIICLKLKKKPTKKFFLKSINISNK